MGKYETGIFQDIVPYLKMGNGPRIIVIFPGTESLFNSLSGDPELNGNLYSQAVPPEFTAYIFDYPQKLDSTATFESIAGIFASVIQKQFEKKVIIVAISYGGMVAIPFTVQYPNLVEKLFLLVSAYALSEDCMKKFVANSVKYAQTGKFLKMYHESDDIYNVWWMRWLAKILTLKNIKKLIATMNPISTFLTAYNQVITRNGELKKYLAKIQSPTIVMGGTKDKCFSESLYRETVTVLPNGTLVLFPGAGHMLPIERLKEFKIKFFSHLK
jgi:pimeloyl-ACP methyl ester carboxylesterase